MAEHVEVFISATTRDLGSYRREIKDALLTLQIFPIEQSNFALAHGPLIAMLRDLIGRCGAVIHVAGLHYGAEPPQRPPGQRRRSYTQIEYDVARELGKPMYLFLAAENYEADERSAQNEEEKELQLAHRRAISNCGDFYVPFADHEVLRTKVRELRFIAPSGKVPRRVVNLPDNSLGPSLKVATLRSQNSGSIWEAALIRRSTVWAGLARPAWPSNTPGATRVIIKMRCSSLVLAPR